MKSVGAIKASTATAATAALILELERAGIALALGREGKLKLSGPESRLTPELLSGVRAQKAELLKVLRTGGGGQSSAPSHHHRGDSQPSPARAEDRAVKLYLKRVEEWPPAARAEWEERAAIMEYDGGLPREQAELVACARIILALDLFPPN